MPQPRQPAPMAVLAEQLLIDMAAEAGEGLVSTPGDPMHAVVIARLEVRPSRVEPSDSASPSLA